LRGKGTVQRKWRESGKGGGENSLKPAAPELPQHGVVVSARGEAALRQRDEGAHIA